ncbi:MAG TPA: DUF885 domain-containing protein [Candidatus Eisenbacteria bacterium]|nr:DUF885 domain-containing protein [Candidatus Eisenbacteria bacterium]
MKCAAALLLLLLMPMMSLPAQNPPPAAPSPQAIAAAEWNGMVDHYFDAYFHFHPTMATYAGFHQYDSQLEDYSQRSRDAELSFLLEAKQAAGYTHTEFLNEEQRLDLKILSDDINARILGLQEIRMWQKSPDLYSSTPTASIFLLMSRKFAPAAERLKSVIAREQQIPANLAAARANLKNPPRVYTEVAIEQMPGIVSFFQKDVPEAFKDVTDAQLLAQFKTANDTVINELQRYETFLKNDLLPISKGDYRLGPELYRKKLLYDDMVDIPLDRLQQIGYDDLHKNQAELKRVAAQIDPTKTPEQVLAALEQDHPQPNQLLQSFRDTFSSLISFIQEKKIITIPSDVRPIVQETPPFARALSSASMDTPGPYETKATEAFFNVTLPDPSWSAEKTKSWMEGFNRGTIISTAIHEAYPGHYEQFLWAPQFPSKVRKLIGCGTNIEGWAHYTEQMMLDEGYGNGDPKLRIGQLQDALLRDARYIVGIEMHTGKMTLAQATQFFVKEGHQTQAVAEREAKRGTSDPTYLVYTLGKLEILKLRADYKQKVGASFTLQQFHDEFMKQGYPPIPIVRRSMLGTDSPAL